MLQKQWIRHTLLVLGLLAGHWLLNRFQETGSTQSRCEQTHLLADETLPGTNFWAVHAEVDTDDSDSGLPEASKLWQLLQLNQATNCQLLLRPFSSKFTSQNALYLMHCAWRHHLSF